MKVTAINGSPKAEGSISGLIIKHTEQILGEKMQLYHALRLVQGKTAHETVEAILDADVLLVVFPLYVDSLPAPLTELLTRLEDAARCVSVNTRVFAIANCGLYEPEHTALALDMVRFFAERSGFEWGCGLGIGRGGMLASMGKNWSGGPVSGVYAALCNMADAMRDGRREKNGFAAPKFPRFLYIAAANMGWRTQARQNGVRKRLKAQPYAKGSG
ncbi:MAG: NAD(P)H-dependent oxidoreductase [Clostridia bacterium]|nr:NAD(P)H-dependent oxidoreductase [Clostridia bacterium]